MNLAYKKIEIFLPFNNINYKDLNDDSIGNIDSFLFRFTKLQDTIGQKLFTLFLKFLEEEVEIMSFLDILNRLEKLEYITSSKNWILIRKIRNEITHEYSKETSYIIQNLNIIFSYKDELIEIFNKIKNKFLIYKA